MKTKIKNINIRRGLFLVFAFAMTATLSFLAIHNMTKTDAASFQAGDIISDAVMSNYNSMSESDINNFMHSKNSCNDTNLSKRNRYPNLTYQIRDGHFLCLADQTFNGQSSAHIIWQAAQDYRINPQVLLVLLQKEQSLITDTWPDDQQIRKATGFACTDSAPCDPSKSGFENQIRKAANLYRTVLDGGWTNYPVGNNYVKYHPQDACGGSNVYIANRATSALYRYTPYQPGGTGTYTGSDGKQYSCYSYGNENFFKYFTNWFGDTHAIADTSSIYLPDGTYNIKTTASKALSFSNGTNNESSARLAESDSSELQKFQFIRDGRFYRIKNIASGRYLDVSGAGTTDGTDVQIYDKNDTCAQKWLIEIYKTSQTYTISSACSGKALDVDTARINIAGSNVQIWAKNNTVAQEWVFQRLDNPILQDGTYNMRTPENKNISLDTESISDGTDVKTGDFMSAYTQWYKVSYGQDGYYRIKNIAADKPLDVESAGKDDGSTVQIYTDNNTCAQRWIIERNSDGYRIRSACSGKSLDVSGAKVGENNIKIQIWSNNDTSAQKWYFTDRYKPDIKNNTYELQSSLNSDYILSIEMFNQAYDGINANIWGRSNNPAQQFRITRDDNTGYYTIENIFAHRVLDVSGASKSSGANVQAWTSNNTCAQKWSISPAGNNEYKIISSCSGLALDVQGAIVNYGNNVQIYKNNNTNAQKWKFITPENKIIVDDGVYFIRSSLEFNTVLDVESSRAAFNGSNLQIWGLDKRNPAQQFRITRDDNTGYYTIENIFAHRVLDVSGASKSSGANVQAWTSNNTCAQKWSISPAGNNEYKIISSCSGLALDVQGAIVNYGNNVQIYKNNNTNAQKWKILK